MTIKVLIADDHAIVRAGLRTLITSETDLKLISEATGGLEAIEKVHQFFPDILVLDISMPDIDGIEVIRTLQQEANRCAILVLTVHEDEALLREALRLGASGYILKHAAESGVNCRYSICVTRRTLCSSQYDPFTASIGTSEDEKRIGGS